MPQCLGKYVNVLYSFFWVIPWRMNFMCRRFEGLYMKMLQSVPKCWNINFRSRGITQKKEYNIQNTTKV